MSGQYDLMILLDPNAPEERQSEILSNVRQMIDADGSILGEQDWGTRRMAFEIRHQPDAAYHLIQLESEPPLLERLRHNLKIADGVIRHRIIRVKPGAPTPPAPRSDAPRPREDAEGDTHVAPRAAADA